MQAITQRPDGELTAFDRIADIHSLAHAYYTQTAFRHGAYVAKLAAYPGTAEQEALAGRKVTEDDDRGVLRALVASWAENHETVFELRAQLRTDAETMPVDDASVRWPEQDSPYRPIATVRLPPQDPYSDARRVFADDRLAFRPMNGLVAHEPLGAINRLREHVYGALGTQRFAGNAASGT